MSQSEPSMPPNQGPAGPASVPTPTEPTTGYTVGGPAIGTTTGSMTGSTTGPGSGSTTDVAKEQAGDVKETAKQAGGQVVQEAKQQAANVAGEVKEQTGNLVHQGFAEIRNQTGQQQQRLAGTVHSWAKELGAMASSSDESGPMTDLVQDAARRGGELAHWLENHEPRDILQELRSFARRRPGTFLLAAAAAGVLAGRFTRGLSAQQSSGSSGSPTGELSGGPARALPASGTYPTTPRLEQSSRDPAAAARGTGTGTSGIGSANAGTGPFDTGPTGPGGGTTSGTGLGTGAAGPASAGPGFGPGGVGLGASEPAVSGEPPTGAADPTPSVPPSTPRGERS